MMSPNYSDICNVYFYLEFQDVDTNTTSNIAIDLLELVL